MGGGKLGSWFSTSGSTQPGGSGRFVLLVDKTTGDKFLVDTGAVFSVLPFSSSDLPTAYWPAHHHHRSISDSLLGLGGVGVVCGWHLLQLAVSES